MKRRKIKLSRQLSLRQTLLGSQLSLFLLGIFYALFVVISLYHSKKDAATAQFAFTLERKQEELDRILLRAEQDLALMAHLTVILTSFPPERMAQEIEKNFRELISRTDLNFNAYVAFERPFSLRYFKKPGMVIGVKKDENRVLRSDFNDPATFTSLRFEEPFYQSSPREIWYHQARGQIVPRTSQFYFDSNYMRQTLASTSRGVFLSSGEFIGVVGIDTLAETVQSLLDSVRIGKTGGLVLVDERGRPFSNLIKSKSHLFGLPEIQIEKPGVLETVPPLSVIPHQDSSYRGQDGENYLTQARPLRSTPWSIVAYQKTREAYRAPVNHTLAFIAFGLVVFIILYSLGRLLALRISGSVNQLVNNLSENSAALADLDRGAQLRPAQPDGPREFQFLAHRLNELYDRLTSNMHLLKQEANRAEKATEAKSRFLSVMSHEIRTPLNSMLGLTDVLAKSALNEEQQSYLKVLQRSGENLLRILNDILDFSRLEAGKLEIDYHEFDLYDLINTVEQLKRIDAEAKGIKLQVIVPEQNHLLIGDSTRIRQILLNLVGNAVKFTERGGVTLKVVEEKQDAPDSPTFLFEIEDTGIGIPPGQLSSIFQEFSQGDRTIPRRYGGTGLGLSITQQILELLESRLEVKSQEGRGSLFSFRLRLTSRRRFPTEYSGERRLIPVKRDTTMERPAPRVSTAPGAQGSGLTQMRGLLVDDDEDNHRLISAYLKFHPGVTLDHAYTGAEALRLFQAQPYDFVFMDLQMPEMDGIEAVRLMRELERRGESIRRRVPIVIISANTFPEDHRLSLEAGADEHVAKPIKLAKFSELIRTHAIRPGDQRESG